MQGEPGRQLRLPEEPIDRLIEPLERFMHVEAAGGIVLLACTVVALALANSPVADAYLPCGKSRPAFTSDACA